MKVSECYQYFLDWYDDRVPETYEEAKHLFHLMDELGLVEKPESRLAQFLDYLQGVRNSFKPESEFERMIHEDYEKSQADDFILSVYENLWRYKGCFPPDPSDGNVAVIGVTGGFDLL